MSDVKTINEDHMRYENETPADSVGFVPPTQVELALSGNGVDAPLPATLIRDKQLEPPEEALLVQQWHEFNRVRQLPITRNSLLERVTDGILTLPQGTLLHGTTYSLERMRAIKDTGIMSGEFVGIPEDNETHYCADFFRVPQDMTLSQYQKWTTEIESIPDSALRKHRMERSRLATPLSRGKQLTFIVDAKQPELATLLRQDVYNENADPNLKKIINEKAIPDPQGDAQTRRLAAILCGIPSNGINGIVVGSGLTTEEIDTLRDIFGSNVTYFSANGELLQPPVTNSSDNTSSPQ